MDDRKDPAVPSWRHKLPLVLGIITGGLLFVYLVIPGIVLGLLFKTGVVDPKNDDLETRRTVHSVFCIPMFLGDAVKPIGDFYEWQVYVVSGYR